MAPGDEKVRFSKFGCWINEKNIEITSANYAAVVEDFLVRHPEVPLNVKIQRGSTQRTKSPLETLAEIAPGANVISVEVK